MSMRCIFLGDGSAGWMTAADLAQALIGLRLTALRDDDVLCR